MNPSSDWVEEDAKPRGWHRFDSLTAIIASEALPWPAWMVLALLSGLLIGGGISVALTQPRTSTASVEFTRSDSVKASKGGAAAKNQVLQPQGAAVVASVPAADQAADMPEAIRLLEAAERRRKESKSALRSGLPLQYDPIIQEAHQHADRAKRLRLSPVGRKALLAYLEAQVKAFKLYRMSLTERQSAPEKAQRLMREARGAVAEVQPLRERAARLLK